ncbi:MAG TPA: TonB family protein [Armatimonadota bacterium]|jgi:protein TonB
MNTTKKNLYRAWLPLSVLVHLLLLAVLYVVKIPLPRAEAMDYIPIVVVPDPTKTAVIPPKAVPPTPLAKTKVLPPLPHQTKFNKVVNNPNPKPVKNAKPDGAVRQVNPALPPGKGTGKKTAAPDVMRVPGGKNPGAPAGLTGGVGTGSAADGLGPEGGGGSVEASALPGGPHPTYPKSAEAEGHEGTVILSVRIGSDGHIDSINVSNSSGYPELDSAATRAARGWNFKPAMKGGVAVSSTVQLRARFENGQKPRLTSL